MRETGLFQLEERDVHNAVGRCLIGTQQLDGGLANQQYYYMNGAYALSEEPTYIY